MSIPTAESPDANLPGTGSSPGLLAHLDYSVLQQCMHCGMCLPTCPTYDATKLERHSPRGRIALMRAIADEKITATAAFGDEMYFCLGCLACETACPAGVNYAQLFETARAEVERVNVLSAPQRNFWRATVVKFLFTRPRLLRLFGRGLWLWQASGGQWLFRKFRLNRLLPSNLRRLEPQAPRIRAKFSHQLIRPVERPDKSGAGVSPASWHGHPAPDASGASSLDFSATSPAPDAPALVSRRVALLTGCVQDLVFSDINRDTADVLLANGVEVHTPPVQPCCGSLHAHNGDLADARALARRLIDLMPPENYDAIITNAGGCGAHLKSYGHLLHDDPAYAARAALWDKKVRDIHEYLAETGCRPPATPCRHDPAKTCDGDGACESGNHPLPGRTTYHESCHLCHGQKVTKQPRDLLRAIPGLELVELPESNWCCGSAGIYNITQPEMSAKLLDRKLDHIAETGATLVTTANPGCHIQLENGLRARGRTTPVRHPISLLAEAYRREK
ncbi:hypothetical protein OPIT5_25985 [Opitutaceae bacterium TAV5]|nr:hypothetical protein OPIT5_25985 [Opitutaceae bacterium TAV5]